MSSRFASVPLLDSVPDLRHGFEQRSPGAPAESRDESRSRVSAALASSGVALFLRQVHGVGLVEAPWRGCPEGDAALCDASGFLLAIETADCLPLLLVDPVGRRVAAAHAGWRGTAASIASRTVQALAARGSRPADLRVALGPAIGVCCYEVGPELREAFGAEAAFVLSEANGGRLRLDLRLANVRQLLLAGVPQEQIAQVEHCTRCRREDYHSYRRDGKGAGRMISFVGFSRGEPGRRS